MASSTTLNKENPNDSAGELESNDFQDLGKPEGKSKKKKIIKTIILLLIFLSFIGGVTAILVFNVFDIRDTYLRDFLESIPVVSNILPPLEGDQGEAPVEMSNAELLSLIENLQSQVNMYEDEINHLNEVNSLQSSEILRLQEIEQNQLQFRADQEAFDRMIAENDPNAFMTFFRSMDPENAELLYSEAVVSAYRSAELREYIATFEAMNRRNAATALEEMMGTEIEIVVSVLSSMSASQRAAMLDAMDTENAAFLLTMLAPENLG